MAAQSHPTRNSMHINTLDNTANTNELSLFTIYLLQLLDMSLAYIKHIDTGSLHPESDAVIHSSPSDFKEYLVAVVLAVVLASNEHMMSHTYVQLPTSSYMVLARAHVCHVRACAPNSHV